MPKVDKDYKKKEEAVHLLLTRELKNKVQARCKELERSMNSYFTNLAKKDIKNNEKDK
jgi:hypothetical protein